MRARDVMTPGVVTVPPEATVQDIAALLLERRISAVAVVGPEGRVHGVVSESDLMRRPELGTDRPARRWLRFLLSTEDVERDFIKTHGLRARDVMTQPAVGVTPETSLTEIVQVMGRRGIKRVLVLDQGRLTGIVTRTDLLRALHARGALAVDRVPVGDEGLRDAILRTLADADWASGAIVNVQVSAGQVELWGAVESAEQRRAIRVAVEGVPGVRGVVEHYAPARAG